MKTLITILFTLFVITISTFAQDKNESVIPTNNINVVFITTSEQTTIKHSYKDEVRVTSYLFKEGNTWGIKIPSERPSFEIEFQISNDTLFIQSPERFFPKVVGVNTYSESIENVFEIPSNKKIVFAEAGQLHISDIFLNIIVAQSERISCTELNKNDFSTLNCTASNNLIINGVNKNPDFELKGLGKQSMVLNANEIYLNIK